ncbi:hypothetical protein [Paenibacillus sp. Cedars]|uniref:hypothetical protein n=1 Tax=Paenibacillus sp. Cedars TaxID=1980674 RepID=UPI001164D931|nr:hypothetical protein [Paenibacillus sp. Cedars]AWP25379.1 hypothetical protein B9D94_01400 [Paenibacillus sp. Cedars]
MSFPAVLPFFELRPCAVALFFVPQLYAVHVWYEPDRSAFFAEWIFCSRKELRGSQRKAERFLVAIGSKIIKIRMKETGSPGSTGPKSQATRKDAGFHWDF